MSARDARRQALGIRSADIVSGVPRCARCHQIRVLSPCRDCATREELKDYPPAPAGRHNPEMEKP